MSALLESLAVLALLLVVPGWAAARALDMRTDLFARVWLGFGITSIVALQLADVGSFSLTLLLGVLGVVSGLCVVVGRLRTRLALHRDRETPRPPAGGNVATTRALAFAAGIAAFLACWPPYETVIAASDSTMYVNAGIHLARTGTLAVHDTIVPLFWPFTARNLFPSVSYHGFGPFIRLPGGLLMTDLFAQTHVASPAFFPLLSIWAGILVSAGGMETATAIAPILIALAVWSVVLFAGEAVGTLAAAATALLLVGNFAFWWFGRFAMAEPLTCALLWGGLVLLGRALVEHRPGVAVVAGVVVGLAGLARTETFLFVAAAGALWVLGERVGARMAVSVAAGFAAVLAFAATIVRGAPSHHLAYLTNEGGLHVLALMPRLTEAWQNGSLALACVVVSAFALGAGAFGRRRGIGFARGTLAALVVFMVVASVLIYARLAMTIAPWRHLGWLAAYCSWPLLAFAPIGAVVVWRRGPVARLAVILLLLVGTVFLLNPRVAPYQPWAIRRFLPVVIPGLTIAAAAALARLAEARRRALGGLVAIVVALGIVALEVRPILAVRSRPYFAGSFGSVAELAERFPPDAIVVFDSSFADLQFQVPLWLAHGRETMMVSGDGPFWHETMRSLLAGRRRVYWVDNVYAPVPRAPGLSVRPVPPDLEFRVPLPDGPADVPPGRTVNRLVLFRIYQVRLAL